MYIMCVCVCVCVRVRVYVCLCVWQLLLCALNVTVITTVMVYGINLKHTEVDVEANSGTPDKNKTHTFFRSMRKCSHDSRYMYARVERQNIRCYL